MAITVRKGGNVIFEKGYGFADLEMRTAVNPSKTFFRAASVSKPIAATALLMAVSQGLIALDASLYFYVPYFPKKKNTILPFGNWLVILPESGVTEARNMPLTVL